MPRLGMLALIVAALIAIAIAIAHLSCIFLGPACFEAQLAPAVLIESSANGTWLAPIATIIVSGLFILCALFALSGAGLIRKLPLTNMTLIVIAGLCLLRGIATVPLSSLFPEMVNTYSVIAGMVWFLTGVLFAYGYLEMRE